MNKFSFHQIKRMWVNQPSTLQPDHKLNGTNVLALDTGEKYIEIFFLNGDVISQRIARLSLSLGWK